MKPIFQVKENHTINDSFIVRYLDKPHSSKQYHYHEEYELLYNIQNSGIRCIGDSIERYGNNDLVFIGNRIPHFWHSDEMYFSDDPDFRPNAVIVHFGKDVFSNMFDSFPELADLKKLLERSGSGIHFRGIEARVIGEKIISLTKLTGWKRLLMLIEILSIMNETNNYRLLSSTSFLESPRNCNEERINKIFNLMIEKHSQDLTLEEAAYHVNMSVSAFCRYFKKHTTKTYSQVLNEIRIGFACKSLMYTENTISEIAFNSGYKNVPYFNRLFKKMKDATPNEYRQNHIKMVV
jgi:AraC-like DNA-binding protein